MTATAEQDVYLKNGSYIRCLAKRHGILAVSIIITKICKPITTVWQELAYSMIY